jgi:hypothetical protein
LVFRSDRKSIFDIKRKRYDTGPGQYLPIDIRTKIEPTKIPFSSSVKKESDLMAKQGTPGPGFYSKDEDLEKFFVNLNRQKYKKRLGPIYKSLDIDQVTTLEPLGFLSKLRRFDKRVQEELPGPGHYASNKDIDAKKESKSPMNSTKTKKILYQPNKLVSIPAKHQSFGYQIKEGGVIEIAEDPLKNFRHKGLSTDSAGPGEYDLNLPWTKKNKGTEWSKYKSQKNDFPKKKSQEDLLNTSKIQITPNVNHKHEIYERNKKEKEKFFKELRGRVDKRHKLVEEKNKSFTTNDFDKLRNIMVIIN